MSLTNFDPHRRSNNRQSGFLATRPSLYVLFWSRQGIFNGLDEPESSFTMSLRSTRRIFPNNLPLPPRPFFPTRSIQLAVVPDPPATVFHMMKRTNVELPLVLVSSRTTDHQEFTRTICAEGRKYRATFFVSSGPSRDSNSSISIFKLLLSSRYCTDRSVSRTPHLVFHFEVPLLLFK